MLNTQSSEFTESIQDQKNFQVFVRVRPQNKDDLQQQLSSRKSPDRFQKSNQSIQQQQQFSSLYGSSSPINSSLISKQNANSMLNNCQPYLQMFGGAYNSIAQSDSIIRVDEENNTIYLNDPEYRNVDKREKLYPFDGVISENSTNQETFEKAVLPQLSGILEGYNATFFAYGITGSGKTHTIFGRNGGLEKQYSSYNNYLIQNSYNNNNGLDQNMNCQNQEKNSTDRGICYMAIEYLLQNIDKQNSAIKFSFLEIYNENVRDLLNGQNNLKNLTIIEDPATKNICVQDLKEYTITSIAQIEELIQEGNQRRALAPTSGNQFSSRSHAILILTVQQRNIDPINKVEEILTSKLTIIDLAGSEKGSDKQGKGSLEGSNINRSLLALGNCINILSEKKKAGHHVPYRDSKLTRILKDTLGGNTKTVMIACISQSYSCLDETINTLNYASRATNIKRKINKNITQELDYYQQKELIKELQNELAFYKCSKSGNNGTSSVSPNSFNSNTCETCQKNKKSLLSYDYSNFESVYAKSTAHSSLDTKIKQEKQLIQGQIQELTEMIKQSLLLENSLGEDITDESLEYQIRIRNEQQGNQEEFLNRIFESHQLISSLQEIEELLVQDYQKLLFYQKNPLQTPQVSGIINQLQDSIRENEEIKEKMKLVLETNQEQKQNLKYVLLRISNKKQIQMEYDLKMRKQQLELLDMLEIKSDLEKQLNIQNTVIQEKDKLIQQINEENSILKSQKQQQKKSFGGINSQTDLPQTFSAIRTQTCPDDNGQISKGMLNQLNVPCKNNSKQAFTQQLLQQEQQQQLKNQLNYDSNKGYGVANQQNQQTQMQINPQQQQQPQSNKQNQSSYKQKNNSLTPLNKDLINNENQNLLQTQITIQGLHNKGSISQTSVQAVSSPQSINIAVSVTPKNEQKSSITLGYGSKTTGKMQVGTPQNQSSYNSTNNFSQTQQNSSTQETNFPLSFGSYNSSVPQISLTNSNIPTGLLKQSNVINSHQTQSSSINSQLQPTQQQQQGNTSNAKFSPISQISNNKQNNPLEHEKENKKSDYSQDEYIQSILSAYSNNNSQMDAYSASISAQQLQQQQVPQQFTSLTQSNKQTALFTKSKSPSNQQTEYNIMNNIQEQASSFSPNIGQSSVMQQQGLIQSQPIQVGVSNQSSLGLKREPQSEVIDLSQNSAHLSTTSFQGQGKNTHSQQSSGGLQDKFSSQYLQQQPSSNQTLNSIGNNINVQQSGIGLISSYKSRSQSKSGRYDNFVGDNSKSLVPEKHQIDDKKPFLDEKLYSNNNQFTYSGNNTGLYQYSNEPLFGQQDKVQLLSPMDSYKNPMESRDTAFDHSHKKESIPVIQNNIIDINQGLYNKNMNHIYNEYELQSAAIHTPYTHTQLYNDKSNTAENNNFKKTGQSRRLINYDMDDFDDDCEPKIMSRRTSDCKQQQHINDSVTHRNPLETESELDHDEIYNSDKKQSYVCSPQIHKTSRTIQAQNVNLKKKNFDVFENEV